MGVIIPTNEFQTPVTDELLDSLKPEVAEQLLDCINNIEFVKRLISPSRKRAKDLPRDKQGRIIVDLANPHILEDMDYFRQPVLYFIKNGCYTKLRPNGNPNSAYGRWIRRERDRIWNGMVRPSDGEWITGFMYWFLNYCPMMVNKQVEGANFANRIEGFPDMWEGIYWRFHYLDQARFGGLYNKFQGGQHGSELSRRGCSKSYSLAAIMSHNLIMGESKVSHKRFMTILTAYKKEYLSDKDGTLTKFTPILDHCATYTQFPRLKTIDSPNRMVWQMGFRNKLTNAFRGSRNTVAGVSCKDDSEKLRGKRGYILFEEFGSFKNLTNTYNTVRDSVEEGNVAFSMLYLVGTSGDKDSDFEGAKELVYNPKGYNIYALPNVYDKPNQGRPMFSFFFPAYVNRKGCYNHDGVSDVIKALIQILEVRYTIKHNTQDPQTILKKIAEMPITPAEAIIKVKRNVFPTKEINEQLLKLDSNPNAFDDVYVGMLFQDGNGKVTFKVTTDEPIRQFPLGDNKSHGAIEIYQMPQKDKDGNVPRDRYLIGNDPVDQDSSDTLSLSSTFVLDRWEDRIVAEYTGRQDFADENYEILRLLGIFYNAPIMYENNIKGTYSYFARLNCTYMLADTPEYLKEKDMIRGSRYGNSSKGVPTLDNIKAHADMLIRDWLCKPVTIVNDNDEEITVKNLSFIRNRALLQELAAYNPEINTDRVRALGVLMIAREQESVYYGGIGTKTRVVEEDPNYLGNSDFFKRNWRVDN